MSKHRRPSRIARLRSAGPNPLQISIAAGVAGTVAMTGTVVASASDGSDVVRTATAETEAPAVPAPAGLDNPADLGAQTVAQELRAVVDAEQVARAERLAKAKARAIAKRKAAKRAAARARAAAARQAAEARTFTSASRDSDRASGTSGSDGGGDVVGGDTSGVLGIAASAASGARYSYGAGGPGAFDCSGFTSYVYRQMGISLPHSSSAQAGVVQRVSSPRPGDLVFVHNGGGGSIGHVAIYAGGGYWWEAANPSMGVGKHRAWSSAVSYGRVG